MSQFVLVHGSFHGGWVWETVASDLCEAGHVISAPTLTGLGERSHLVSPNIGLSINIRDVVNVLKQRDLTDVVLVGHSYGGMVISGVAEACPDRIERLVYFDGFIPQDGQSAWDIAPNAKILWEAQMEQTGTDWLVAPTDPTEKYGETGQLADWHRRQLTPMAMWTHEESIRLRHGRAYDLPRSYVACTGDDKFENMAKKARTEDFDYYEIDTHHNPILYAPGKVSAVLHAIVE